MRGGVKSWKIMEAARGGQEAGVEGRTILGTGEGNWRRKQNAMPCRVLKLLMNALIA